MRAWLILALFATSAHAHDTGEAKGTFIVAADGAVSATLKLARVDAAELLGLAEDAAPGALDDRLDADAAAQLGHWLTVVDPEACPWEAVAWVPAGVRGITITATARCRGDRPLTVHWLAASRTALDLKLLGSAGPEGGATHLLALGRATPSAALSASAADSPQAADFFLLGVTHMLTGWDHLAFLLALVLGCARLRRLLLIVTSFTVAHSVTLALGATGIITLAPSVVEPVIAASIAAAAGLAAYRLWHDRLTWPGRGGPTIDHGGVKAELALCFGFGLVHGLGFAGLLTELAPDMFAGFVPLLTFNLGVEVAQIAAVSVAFPLLVWVGRTRAARPAFGGLLTGLIALGLMVAFQRLA